ncbi:MAG: tRNA 2-thiouridine(34) synthase MnmA [bacterium]|nr:tRNA 2-thiouridine(34) synthase MnmA [bacterium]
MRVLAAMSGGVDSSVAAAMMHREGHEVTGVTLKLWQGPDGEAPAHGCCTVSDSEDARRVAAGLDIPYYVFDYTDDFASAVVDPFVEAYRNGRTPNPCVECNRSIKFSILLEEADRLDCDLLVTGHYARVSREGGRWRLRRGVDPSKDQSYVLHMLGQRELARTRFPVGEMTKPETRRVAADLGLRNAHKRDSYEICFIADDYRRFIARRAPEAVRPGRIVDASRNRLGEHPGVVNFTVGQRRGLGVAVGEPRYVVELDPHTSTVVIGSARDLLTEAVEVEGVTWVDGAPPPESPTECLVQVRVHGQPVRALLAPLESGSDRWQVSFVEPQSSPAPGQMAVFYRGDRVLGGGTIDRLLK